MQKTEHWGAVLSEDITKTESIMSWAKQNVRKPLRTPHNFKPPSLSDVHKLRVENVPHVIVLHY